MDRWEYCAVKVVAQYREGGGGGPQELLEIRLPGKDASSVSNPFGLVGFLNQLGSKGWELVDVEGATFYLKRRVKFTAGAQGGVEDIATSADHA
jgi:hypothetical protein